MVGVADASAEAGAAGAWASPNTKAPRIAAPNGAEDRYLRMVPPLRIAGVRRLRISNHRWHRSPEASRRVGGYWAGSGAIKRIDMTSRFPAPGSGLHGDATPMGGRLPADWKPSGHGGAGSDCVLP
ncbi:hypothetical protein GCM10023194_36020 [Planotetraspora phitsanulokensis]|uniref:Uncharacterized protein n=1 Tax=Planotetraspora phitsanulokensis TaxID=575192 RepID=A0A8J3UBZ9_9ACTN|nr:hypothetical protein Pph01_12730 [Planotetraspora phitsanulokensis]